MVPQSRADSETTSGVEFSGIIQEDGLTQSTLIQFVDPRHGKCSVSVGADEDDVEVELQLGGNPGIPIRLPGPAAVQLAHSLLAFAGKRAALPQSRQIGGIIGPY